ncbi:MAG: hypothetical protein QHJ73_16820, partial [Armatimonadota bacterium]|nr:hypothetical protein [Armatimonadota bacterium]
FRFPPSVRQLEGATSSLADEGETAPPAHQLYRQGCPLSVAKEGYREGGEAPRPPCCDGPTAQAPSPEE